jgi:hypothetical protein
MPAYANDNDRKSALPPSLAPRGLSRVMAAEYVGVSPSLFDIMVDDGRMPKPRGANTRKLWDRLLVDEAFSALPMDGANDTNAWDAAFAQG